MRALHLDKTVITFRQEYPRPTPQPGEARVRITLAGICATDLEIMRGYKQFQGVLGHEWVGVVESAPDPAWLGLRVVGEINCGCGLCTACKTKHVSHCPHRTVPGILGRDGVFAEYCCFPLKNLHPIPETLSDQTAVFTEPLAAALEITQHIHFRPNDQVIVIGDGRLGLLVAQILALSGCNLRVIGRHPEKWSILHNQNIPVGDEMSVPPHFKASIVVECSGGPSGFHLACALVQPRGTVVLKSTFHGSIPVDLTDLVVREVKLIGSRCGPFPPAIHLLQTDKIQVEPLISAIYPLEQGIQALEHAGEKGVLKILLKP